MKKRPLTEENMKEIEERLKKDPNLKRALFENFEKGLESMGYFITDEFRQNFDNKLEETIDKLAIDINKHLKREQKKSIKVKVRIDEEKKTREVKILK